MRNDGSESSLRLLGLVLCGGKSKRMGRDKALLPHPTGGNFLEFAVARARQVSDQVVLGGPTRPDSTGSLKTASGDSSSDSPLPSLPDLIPEAGPAASLASALAWAGEQRFAGVMVTPVDTPCLRDEDLRRLVTRWQRHPSQLVVAINATTQKLEPLIAIYPAEYAGAMTKLVLSEDRSLYRWLSNQDFDSVPLPELHCRNINTPEDLQNASQVRF